MEEITMKKIIINKNRGWRGLAELVCRDSEGNDVIKTIFSFSQDVWDDLIFRHAIVAQDKDYYYVIRFNDIFCRLPRADQQRSVLIKNFTDEITIVNRYSKTDTTSVPSDDYSMISNFIKNRNNHTTSDWNCIGVRVMPII